MSKYTNEFKIKVVKYCIEEHHSLRDAAKKFGIPSHTAVKEWIRKYKEHGTEGILKQLKSSYSGDFKLSVVEYMHCNHISATETAVHFRTQPSVVLKWERIYYEEGPQALYRDNRGRKSKMSSDKPTKKKLSKETEEDLIAEIQRLRMENDYLKKLQALVQERIAQENGNAPEQ
jgi:transposase